MKRTSKTPGVKTYFDALSDIFNIQSKVLTGVLPHLGERGSNDEERFRDFLKKILPKKYGVGTGFVVCSNNNQPPSRQTDVVIHDVLVNSPLFSELAANVYPIEMVYASVEVKGTLTRASLRKSVLDITKIRELSTYGIYVKYSAKSIDPIDPEKKIVAKDLYKQCLSPRSYIFAYSKSAWRSISDLEKDLISILKEYSGAHLHGLLVLDKNWFVCQKTHTGINVELTSFSDNGLLRFILTMLHGIQSIPMDQVSLDNYFSPTNQL